jgi:twitching motility two-component system response regulator PilH
MSTVLIVDDVKSDRELIGKVVSATGNQPAYASDGNEAVAKALELRPALVLMDVVMPGLDGYGACRRLKKEPITAAIPVVFITGKITESDRFWGRKQGADEYITKPFTPERLRQVILQYT